MDSIIPIVLLVLGALGGAAYSSRRNKKKAIKEAVGIAEQAEKEGAINATIKFAEKVAKAEEAVRGEIDARPVTGDPVADLADRISGRRSRRAR